MEEGHLKDLDLQWEISSFPFSMTFSWEPKTRLIPRSQWPSGELSFSPSQGITGFGGTFSPFLGDTQTHSELCWGQATSWHPSCALGPNGGETQGRTLKKPPRAMAPQAHGSVTTASILFLMLGICYQSCPLLMGESNDSSRGMKALFQHI